VFQGCKSETEPINTKSVVQHVIRYQVLLLSCNMFVKSHCRLHYTHINRLYTIPSIVAVMQHVCQVTLSTSLHTHQPFVYDTKYCCCRATCLSGHIVDFTTHTSTVCIRYQVLLLSCNMFVRSHCRLHYTHTSTVCIRYQVLLATYYKEKMAVFWVVAPCSLVEVYQRFRGPCCLHHQGDEYTVLQPRRQQSSYSPP
jgi:hypothetical protein